MSNIQDNNYSIEQFTLIDEDFKTFAKLISEAFLADEAAQDEGATIVFSEQTFRTLFGAPGIDRKLMVKALYKPTNEIVGFLGTINKNLSIKGKIYKTAIPSWLVVHPNHQRQGLAKNMGKKMMELGKAAGYQAGFSFHEPNQHGIDASSAVARETNTPLVRLVSLNKFVIRVYDTKAITSVVKTKWFERLFFKLKEKVGKIKSTNVRLYRDSDFDQIYELTMDLVKRSDVSIIPDYQDMKWMLPNSNVLCTVYEDDHGKIIGYILAWEFTLAGFGNRIPFGWLDTVHAYKLNKREVNDLANFISTEAIKRGWKGLQTPYIPYFDAKPFIKANFIFFPKKVGIDLFNWSNIPIPEKARSMYFYWR
ncbi:MAG: GNAT family N-acetyltransferase [Candidatus Heimdallarchaeota archaeon]|nr:GNAT family N-acetyltransferase [Candidatus Heimdallarchaeota archaeon]